MEMQAPENTAAEMRRRLHQLQQLNLNLRRQLEAAELLVPELNAMLSQLNTIQLADKLIWSAGIIHRLPYEQQKGPTDSVQIFQAVLKIPGGIGALVLDSEELLNNERSNPSDPYLPAHCFVPFCECPDGVKALLLPKVPELLDRLFGALAIRES
jgi:hypothetical protein